MEQLDQEKSESLLPKQVSASTLDTNKSVPNMRANLPSDPEAQPTGNSLDEVSDYVRPADAQSQDQLLPNQANPSLIEPQEISLCTACGQVLDKELPTRDDMRLTVKSLFWFKAGIAAYLGLCALYQEANPSTCLANPPHVVNVYLAYVNLPFLVLAALALTVCSCSVREETNKTLGQIQFCLFYLEANGVGAWAVYAVVNLFRLQGCDFTIAMLNMILLLFFFGCSINILLFSCPVMTWGLTKKAKTVQQQQNQRIQVVKGLKTATYDPSQHTNFTYCSICMEDFIANSSMISNPGCDDRHYFHAVCIRSWLYKNSSCPLCKKEVINN